MDREIREDVIKSIDSSKERLMEIARFIHDNPELGFEEYKASAILTDELAKYGFQIEEMDMKTAFRASLGSAKPEIVFLAEYDALPGIGHGCGHNLICTASIGAAIGLASVMHKLAGTIVVLGTPAEETSGTKVSMVKNGVFKDVDAAMMFHPSNKNVVESTSLAMDAIEFTFKGKAAHAAESPHKGINALDGVILFFNAINALRGCVKEDVRMHGIITEGGEAPNIVPEKAASRFYIRASTREYLNEVVEKVKNCARGASLATGTELKIRDYENSFKDLVTNHALAELFKHELSNLGVKEIYPKLEMKGSTDMGDVSHVVPAIHPYLSIAPESVALHTKEFAAAANSKTGHETMILAAKAMAMTALNLITSPDALKDVKDEFSLRWR